MSERLEFFSCGSAKFILFYLLCTKGPMRQKDLMCEFGLRSDIVNDNEWKHFSTFNHMFFVDGKPAPEEYNILTEESYDDSIISINPNFRHFYFQESNKKYLIPWNKTSYDDTFSSVSTKISSEIKKMELTFHQMMEMLEYDIDNTKKWAQYDPSEKAITRSKSITSKLLLRKIESYFKTFDEIYPTEDRGLVCQNLAKVFFYEIDKRIYVFDGAPKFFYKNVIDGHFHDEIGTTPALSVLNEIHNLTIILRRMMASIQKTNFDSMFETLDQSIVVLKLSV